MGILNLTPDSFSDGGAFQSPERALAHAQHLVAQGARMLDLGAESTRPGAMQLGEAEETKRLGPALEALREQMPHMPLSLDTRHAGVALKALGHGIKIINDVTGFQDPALLHLACHSSCGVIAMRSRVRDGELYMPDYAATAITRADEAIRELAAIRDRLLQSGIAKERILLDPGFGFGTTFQEDMAIWEALPSLPEQMDWPIERFCIAVSRKRFLAWEASRPDLPPLERDELTHQAHAQALAWGYRVFRTHALPPVRIRRATLEDVPGITHAYVASCRAAYQGVLPEAFLQAFTVDQMEPGCRKSLLEAPSRHRQVWVIERAGTIAGFAAIAPNLDPEPGACGHASDRVFELEAIYILPSLWRQGHGQRLLAEALKDIGEPGSCILWVMERNNLARTFYEGRGWMADGAARTRTHGGITFREVRYRLRQVTSRHDLS